MSSSLIGSSTSDLEVGGLLPANSWLFQVANFFLLLSYLSVNLMFLRVVLILASLSFVFWGAFLLVRCCSPKVPGSYSLDTILWNSVFTLLNAVQVGRLLVRSANT